MKRISCCIAVVIALCARAGAEEPFHDLNFKDACAKAKKEDKIVLIDFYTTWCGPCKKLDKTTWKDKDVQAWLSKSTIALKVDAEKEKDLARKYEIHAYPTIMLIKPDETEIDRIVGFRDADAFLSEAKDALAGKDSIARAKEAMGGGENDPMKRMRYADALLQKSKKEEALKEYLWCYDHGVENNMAFVGVRSSFLLSKIAQMGNDYPPAKAALLERRDAVEKKLNQAVKEEENTPFSMTLTTHVIDYTSLNRELKQDKRTLETYDKLRKTKMAPFVRQIMLDQVLDQMLSAKRYKDIAEDMDNPADLIEQKILQLKMMQTMRPGVKDDMKSANDYMKNDIIDRAGKFFEAFVGAGDEDEADTIAEKILGFDASKKTYRNLMRHAILAEKKQAAEGLLKRAEKNLSKRQIKSLRRLLEEKENE